MQAQSCLLVPDRRKAKDKAQDSLASSPCSLNRDRAEAGHSIEGLGRPRRRASWDAAVAMSEVRRFAAAALDTAARRDGWRTGSTRSTSRRYGRRPGTRRSVRGSGSPASSSRTRGSVSRTCIRLRYQSTAGHRRSLGPFETAIRSWASLCIARPAPDRLLGAGRLSSVYPFCRFWVTMSETSKRCFLIAVGAVQVDIGGLGGGRPHGGADEDIAVWRNELSGTAGGPVVQSRAIYGDVRISATAPRRPHPVPVQLPVPAAYFTGRSAELAALEGLAARSDVAGGLAIVVIVGSGGLGKTSLASHWLHRFSDRYPDGVLSAELGGHSLADAARPGDVLAGFLRCLGAEPESIPLRVDQQAALFRSVTTGKRMAVFLDNAATAAQVRVLLPGPEADPRVRIQPEPGGHPPGPGGERSWPSLVLVTTRWRIAGLAVDGARFLELAPLEDQAARELFGRIVGTDRVDAEARASREVVRLCGGMPLAVCVSAARLAAHPRWPVSRIARELAAEHGRLSALSLDGDLSVRAAFDVSYRALPAGAARAYRMGALIPGPDFCASLAAAVLDDDKHAQELLDTLADASLLAEGPDGRYRLHDLARLHAREQAGPSSSSERRAAVARSVTWYLQHAVAADRVMLPGRWRLGPLYEQASDVGAGCGSPARALEWLESHLPGLLAAVQAAHDEQLHPQVWQLCEAMWGMLLFRKHYTAWLASHQTGLQSARACADDQAEAQMNIQLGAAHRSLGRLDAAVGHFTRALELFRMAGHRLGEASALDQLGVAELRRGRYSEAIRYFRQALGIHQDIGRPRGIALMTFNIGQALAAAGRQDEAIGHLQAAEGQFAAIGESYHRSRALAALGGALTATGQAHDAATALEQALAVTGELGAAYDRAHVHLRLADLAETLGQRERARTHLEQALGLFTELDAPQAQSVHARLTRSGGDPAPGSATPR